MTSDKKKSDLAWDYLKYGSSPDGQTLVGKLTGFLPFNRVAIRSPERLASYYSERPELAAAAQSLKMAGSWPSFPGPNGLKVHAIITSYMQKVYTGVLDPAAALKAMAKETRALLK